MNQKMALLTPPGFEDGGGGGEVLVCSGEELTSGSMSLVAAQEW